MKDIDLHHAPALRSQQVNRLGRLSRVGKGGVSSLHTQTYDGRVDSSGQKDVKLCAGFRSANGFVVARAIRVIAGADAWFVR